MKNNQIRLLIMLTVFLIANFTYAQSEHKVFLEASTAAYATIDNTWAILPAEFSLEAGENTIQVYANGYRVETLSLMGNQDYELFISMDLAPGVTEVASVGLQNIIWDGDRLVYDQWDGNQIQWYSYDPSAKSDTITDPITQLVAPDGELALTYEDESWQLTGMTDEIEADINIASSPISVSWLQEIEKLVIHDPATFIDYTADVAVVTPARTMYPWSELHLFSTATTLRFLSFSPSLEEVYPGSIGSGIEAYLAAVVTDDHTLLANGLNGRVHILSEEALYAQSDAQWLDTETLRFVDSTGIYDWSVLSQETISVIPTDLITARDAANTLAMRFSDNGRYLALLRFSRENQRELLLFDLKSS